jgi:hypothetical protein
LAAMLRCEWTAGRCQNCGRLWWGIILGVGRGRPHRTETAYSTAASLVGRIPIDQMSSPDPNSNHCKH